MRNKKKLLNIAAGVLLAAVVAVVVWGLAHGADPLHMPVSDGIERVDLDSVYLQSSGVEVDFSDVILSGHNETRKLIVSTQSGTVSTEMTDRLIRQLDFDFLKKTQNVSYTGTGYFVVDLDHLTAADVVQDKGDKTVTIRIGHAYLEAIEQELRARLEEKFDTAANGQEADEIALRMVREVYEPVVRAVDKRYSVVVEFQ